MSFIHKVLHTIRRKVRTFFKRIKSFFVFYATLSGLTHAKINKINLCNGSVVIPGYYAIDIDGKADLYLDLSQKLLPFKDGSADVVVCMSAINYFAKERGQEIINDVYRVLHAGGVARFGVQDLRIIAEKYVGRDREFFFQKLENGQDRFVGETMADKINSWFYGYKGGRGGGGKYVYDYETLSRMFEKAGFSRIEQKAYQESIIAEVAHIDNRPEQMFFLEAIK